MTPDPTAPVELSFGAAYDRLQAVAAELGADATMAPDRLIALLREGKGLERALRDHLERVEQEVRAIEDGEGAVAFRIVDVASSVAEGDGASSAGGAPSAPSPRPPAAPAEPRTSPPPTLGFPGADDDIPF